MRLWHVNCVLAALLAGCAANVDREYDPSKETAKGIAVFSVTHDKGPMATLAAGMHFTFSGESLGGRWIVVESTSSRGSASHIETEDVYGRIYAIEFPAGRNQLTSWSMDNGTGLNVYPTTPPPPLTFEIRPGSVAYLGNLHGNLKTGTNFLGMTIVGDASPEIRDESERDLKLVLQMYPQFAGKIEIQSLPTGPWGTSK